MPSWRVQMLNGSLNNVHIFLSGIYINVYGRTNVFKEDNEVITHGWETNETNGRKGNLGKCPKTWKKHLTVYRRKFSDLHQMLKQSCDTQVLEILEEKENY